MSRWGVGYLWRGQPPKPRAASDSRDLRSGRAFLLGELVTGSRLGGQRVRRGPEDLACARNRLRARLCYTAGRVGPVFVRYQAAGRGVGVALTLQAPRPWAGWPGLAVLPPDLPFALATSLAQSLTGREARKRRRRLPRDDEGWL